MDEQKRRIYDLYGKEGLEAGLELAATEADQEFVRQQWERFKGRAFLQDVHRQAAPRTIVELKVDARKTFKDLINGIVPSVWPVIAEATASTDVNVQFGDRVVLKTGCTIHFTAAYRFKLNSCILHEINQPWSQQRYDVSHRCP